MKGLILLFCSWMIAASLWGQQIVRAEYFIDEDPGHGNGAAIAFTAAPDAEMALTVPLGKLEPGLHNFYSRVKDGNGAWSHTFRRAFLLCKLPQDELPPITRMEYFFDADPGYGLATPAGFQEAAGISVAVDLPLEILPGGIHTLYARVADDNGNWSMVFYRNFLVQKLPASLSYRVDRIEYFFDEDPGYGLANPLEFQPGAEVSVTAELPLDRLSNGLHALYVRARDDKGDWGMVFQRAFMKYTDLAGNARVTRMEYFVNEDPGFGKGTQIELNTPRETVMKYFVVDPGKLQPGTNTLYVRTLDSEGRWGLVYTEPFEVLQAAPCEAPTGLVAADVTETTADLGWTEAGQGTSWDLLRVPAGLDYSEDGNLDTGIVDNPHAVDGLMQSTLYGFYTKTACADGQVSDWGGPGLFHTLPLPVNQLTLLADPPGGGTVTGEGSYTYGETVTISSSPNAHFIFQYWSGDTALLDNTESEVARLTMPAAPVTITAHFLDVTGIRGTPGPEDLQLRIFPNPASELLWIELDSPGGTAAHITLMNTLGQTMLEKVIGENNMARTSLNLSGLDPGLYILVIRSDRWKEERKVIVK